MRRKIGLGLLGVIFAWSAPGAVVATTPLPPVEPGVLQATVTQNVIARFNTEIPDVVLSRIPGLTVHYRFQSVPAVYANATPAAVRALAARRDLAYLEADKPIAFELDSATRASRVKEIWAPESGDPLRDASGNVIDGRGVGIAIVDTGLDGFHPDYLPQGKVKGNWQVTPTGLVEAQYSSTVTDPHGTHVAGIAAGTGDASGGVFRGAAPGATIYSFNMFLGTDGTVVLPSVAFDYILKNGAKHDPPIRVVNNSWRCQPRICQNAFNPNQLHNTLASEMAKAGIVVTWSAGNEGGDGSSVRTNTSSINPTPGILSVANYIDELTTLTTGVRNNRVSGSSSRGDSSDPMTWPDLSAPGSAVTSTWGITTRADGGRILTRDPVTGANNYFVLSGTSMAAPHVAGIAAMMMQANPSLTPAEIEYILKANSDPLPTAFGYVRADAAHPWNGTNYAEGHGLVDGLRAVQAALSFSGIPDLVPTEEIPLGFIIGRKAVKVARSFYLTSTFGLSDAYQDHPPAPAYGRYSQPQTYESAPFTADETHSGMTADIYMGTAHEYAATTHASLRIRVVTERITDAGRIEVAEGTENTWNVAPGQPIHRRLNVFFSEPVTFLAGERLGVKVVLEKRPNASPAPVSDLTLIEGGYVVYTGRPTASRIGLGTTILNPVNGTVEHCRARHYCVTVGGNVEIGTVSCGPVIARLSWSGPAGSSLTYSCERVSFSCVVPGVPGRDPDGTCEASFDTPWPLATREGQCHYVIPGGARGGSGRCDSDVIDATY